MMVSAKVAQDNVTTTSRNLMSNPNTNWAAISLFDKKLPEANLSSIKNMDWYSTTDIPSYCLKDRSFIFVFTLTMVKKYWE